MKRVIAIGLAPNIQKDDVFESLRLFLSPWEHIQGKATRQLEHWFEDYFGTANAVSFINARSGLYAILKNLGIGQGDEVLIQAYTCVAVPNAIIATGATPIYVDIDSTFNINTGELKKKITQKTKAILVQHTYGIPADMERVVQIVNKHNIYLIEDVAHTIGGEYKERKLGTFGIASIFSFGRDKAFSSVFGGMVITNDHAFGVALRAYQKQRGYPSLGWVWIQLLYPSLSSIVLRWYYFLSIGKLLHFLLRKLNFFSLSVTSDEKRGLFSPLKVQKMPNAFSKLALVQLAKLEKYNLHRKKVSGIYSRELMKLSIDTIPFHDIPLLRYPLLAGDKKDMLAFFRKDGVYLGDWYNQSIDPKDVDLSKVFYSPGSCPKAEETAKHMVNLPTYPTMSQNDILKVLDLLKHYAPS